MLHDCCSFRSCRSSGQHRRRPWGNDYCSRSSLRRQWAPSVQRQPRAAACHFSFLPTRFFHRRFLYLVPKTPSSTWAAYHTRSFFGSHATTSSVASIPDQRALPVDPALDLDDHLDLLLQRCSTPLQATQVHALSITCGAHDRSAFLAARLVSVYSRLGLLDRARAVFRVFPAPRRTSLLWNSVLRAYRVRGWPSEVLSLYSGMQSGRLSQSQQCPDGFTFPLVVRACSSIVDAENLGFCRAVHAHTITAGYQSHLHVANELVFMYGVAGLTDCARALFDRMRHRTVASCNMLMSGFACSGDCEAAVGLLQHMESHGPKPNEVTWTSLLSAHAQSDGRRDEVLRFFYAMRSRDSKVSITAEAVAVVLSVVADSVDTASFHGRGLHCFTLRSGFEGYFFIKNSLVSLYGKLRCVKEAEAIFSETRVKTLVSWNALLSCYAEAGLYHEAYEVFSRLEGGELEFIPNAVSWTTMIGAFQSAGLAEQAVRLFRGMQETRVYPDPVTVNTVLLACAELASLQYGKQLHGYVIRRTRDGTTLVQNGLLKAYCRCGNLEYARRVFVGMDVRDVISWNTMMSGYGANGLCNDVLLTFDDMLTTSDVEPDSVTFVAALSACSHAGHVSLGCRLFKLMVHKHNLSPTMEHYSCMVDLLGRAGLLEEAAELVEKMPMEPNTCVWGSLLNSCHIHGNPDVAERVASKAFSLQLESGNILLSAGSYMLLSNVYASSGRWDDSARVRAMSKENGARKQRGQSWIELKNKVHVFSAGDELPLDVLDYYYTFVFDELHLIIDEDSELSDDQLLQL